MKIGIVGQGFVGNAVTASHKNDTLVVRDPKLKEKSASIDDIKSCDAVYICVPTPMSSTGQCDDSFIRGVLEELKDYDHVIICKSTAPPSIYKELNLKYPNVVHSPEFLTAANAVNDYLKAQWILVGGNPRWTKEAIEVIKSSSISAKKFVETDIQTASFFKYLANSFLATKVTFMNDMYKLSAQLGIAWKDVKEISTNDLRLGNTHWDVPGPDGKFGYGGACFPKDVAAIIAESDRQTIDLKLLKTVESINLKHRQ
jgi:UDPglucose 6-dehydrogenase